LVIWAALEKLGAAGMRELNFGRSEVSNEGLRRFKRGWGSREYMIRYARYSFSPAGFMSGKGARIARHTRVLTMMPVALSRCWGTRPCCKPAHLLPRVCRRWSAC
jgi:hypothetical protein